MTKTDRVELLEEATTEERNYNWQKAADLYEQLAQVYLGRRLSNEAANLYVKLGDIYIRAVLASETKEEYLKYKKHSIKAYYIFVLIVKHVIV